MQDDRFGAPRRPRTNGNGPHRANGNRPEGVRARPVPFDEVPDEPVDLVAVQADDELINALASGMAVSAPGYGGYDADDQVAALLASWKAEVDAEPFPELVDLDTAVDRVRAASRPPGRRSRYLVPVAAAAAVAVFSIGGVTIGAGSAGPDDGVLWEIARVVDSERTESVLAAERVEERIAEAKEALTRGEPEVAAQVLAAAEDDLAGVRAEEGAAELAEVQSFLEAKAAETPQGTRTQPGAPLASDPTRPVPPGAATGDPVTSEPGAPEATSAPSEAATSPTTSPDPSPLENEVSATTDPSPTPEGGPAPGTSPTPTATVEGGADGGAAPADGSFGSSRSDGGQTPSASGAETPASPTS